MTSPMFEKGGFARESIKTNKTYLGVRIRSKITMPMLLVIQLICSFIPLTNTQPLTDNKNKVTRDEAWSQG